MEALGIFLFFLILAAIFDAIAKRTKLQKEQNEILKQQNTAISMGKTTDELTRIFELKEKGAISDAEYEQMKRKIMEK